MSLITLLRVTERLFPPLRCTSTLDLLQLRPLLCDFLEVSFGLSPLRRGALGGGEGGSLCFHRKKKLNLGCSSLDGHLRYSPCLFFRLFFLVDASGQEDQASRFVTSGGRRRCHSLGYLREGV